MPGSRSPRRAVDQDSERVVSELLTASRLLVAIAARSLAAVEESLTLPQYRMLVVLDAQGPVSLARMAELLDVNPSTAPRMVERTACTRNPAGSNTTASGRAADGVRETPVPRPKAPAGRLR